MYSCPTDNAKTDFPFYMYHVTDGTAYSGTRTIGKRADAEYF